MRTIRRLAGSMCIAALLAHPSTAQWKGARGYTAVQAGATPTEGSKEVGESTVRSYHNIGLENGQYNLNMQGLNEARTNGYSFGRNSLRIGKEELPAEAIVVSRHLNGKLVDAGVGTRLPLDWLPGTDYGFVDLLKHTGAGSGYDGVEMVTFTGRKIGPVTVENTTSHREGDHPFFLETEVLFPTAYEGKCWMVRPYLRHESMDLGKHTITGGVQFQLK